MEEYQSFSLGSQGELTMGGVSLPALAERYGTPLYVMDEEKIRHTCRAYQRAMKRNFGDAFHVSYASKALCVKGIYPILKEEGMCADVVSGGELYTALQAGFDPAKLHFHGNNKSREEMAMAIKAGIGSFIADSEEEIHTLNELGGQLGKTVQVALRVKPGVDAHTHEFISTGDLDSKFGFGYENGHALKAACLVSSLPHLELCGIHCHIGSQVFLTEPYKLACRVMFQLLTEIGRETGTVPPGLNLGGGFGIAYGPEDKPLPVDEMIDALGEAVREGCRKHNLPQPFITIEPGRSIVGPAGVTLYRVGSVKHIENVRTYVAVDGGMPDNPRYALYGASYQAVKATDPKGERTLRAAIAGKCCESGDLVTKDALIQPVQAGDLLCVFATGAYNYSMASNYNRLPRPPIVMVRDGKDRLLVKRESYEQLVQNDM